MQQCIFWMFFVKFYVFSESNILLSLKSECCRIYGFLRRNFLLADAFIQSIMQVAWNVIPSINSSIFDNNPRHKILFQKNRNTKYMYYSFLFYMLGLLTPWRYGKFPLKHKIQHVNHFQNVGSSSRM